MSENAPVLDEAALLERVGAPRRSGPAKWSTRRTREPIGRAPVHTVEELDAAVARARGGAGPGGMHSAMRSAVRS